MITHIEIDGFKTFRNLSVDFRPFQVLLGPVGAGKSNLFDAIALLSRLVEDNTVVEAFGGCRGDIDAQFSLHPDGNQAQTMRFAVELLIDQQITDPYEVTGQVSSTRLRYELSLERREDQGATRLYVTHESLRPIPERDDHWFRANIPPGRRKGWIVRKRREAYLSTSETHIFKHQDRHSGKLQSIPLGRIERTVLSGINTAAYPTAYAVRQAIRQWRCLQLNPQHLRLPIRRSLPGVDCLTPADLLHHIAQQGEPAIANLSRDLGQLVPEIAAMKVTNTPGSQAITVSLVTSSGTVLPLEALSDGALRLLTLTSLRHDPNQAGLICLEEPENGLHPGCLEPVIEQLRSLATHFEEDSSTPLKQLLVNSHSPHLLAAVKDDQPLFVHMPPQTPGQTQISPISTQLTLPLEPDGSDTDRPFTTHDVMRILDPSWSAP